MFFFLQTWSPAVFHIGRVPPSPSSPTVRVSRGPCPRGPRPTPGPGRGVICYLLKAILVPFLFSIVLMYIFKPAVDAVSRPFRLFQCGAHPDRPHALQGAGCAAGGVQCQGAIF